MRFRRVRMTGIVAALGLTLTTVLSGCGGGDSQSKPTPSPVSSTTSPSAPVEPVSLTFGVYGSKELIAAYQDIVDAYRAVEPSVHITIRSWPDEPTMARDLAHGGAVPDVFLTAGSDLQPLIDDHLIRPVDTYLDARNVDLGDNYAREALESFSVDQRLQCMPYFVSPNVVYYNTHLVNFKTMQARGLPAPPQPFDGTWSIDDFKAAVRVASKPRRGIKGVYVEPTVRGVAPWLVAAGGHLFDDSRAPTRLAFSDSVGALQSILPTLTDPRFRLSNAQLGKSTPLQWFERGKLAMFVGNRSLVPQLRADPNLDWDVMAMPSSLKDGGTTGGYSGLCLSGSTKNDDSAADFLTYLITDSAVAQVTRTGYVVPVNQEVAYTHAFTQPDRLPKHGSVFLSAIKGLQTMPAPSKLDELDTLLGSELNALLAPRGYTEAEILTGEIDNLSSVVLAPPSASPSASPGESDTGSAGG